jgi:osmoprotectant transport system permease protein
VGYRPLTRMLKVDLPLSIPVLVASLRVIAVTNISMVAVGYVIGIGGLGTWFGRLQPEDTRRAQGR